MIADALAYAQLGWRVHPCRPGEKKPLLEAWPTRATTDPTIIERWWGRSPQANIGVATGPGSGIFVLDVDGIEGERSLVALERRHGSMPDLYPMQWTGGGRGGWHAIFAWPAGYNLANSAGRLGPKLDIKSEGGQVLVPPSRTIDAYRWADDRDPWFLPPEPAPAWLVELLDPPQPQRETWQASHHQRTDDRYLLRALEAELALVASAPEGRRNDQLNESAFALFRFAQEGRLPADAIAHGLEQAALYTGLSHLEIAATIRSAASKRGLSL